MLPTAVARSSSGGVALRYVLPVLWMTLGFHTMAYGGVTLPQLQPRCNVMHRLTPLLCGICCVLFCPRLERALRLEEPFVKGLPGRMQCIIALLSLLTAVASSMLRRQGD